MNMETAQREQGIHRLFLFVVLFKALDGVLELALAILLALSKLIWPYVMNLASNEIIEDPNDFLATHITALSHPSQSSLLFAALYLSVHGLVKISLALGLWFNKIWAYPAAMGVISVFIVFQLLRVLQRGSMLLLALTLIDCVFVWLIYHEYRRALARSATIG